MVTQRRRIGVFDSGVGGLTVVRQLVEQFGQTLDIVYLGDTARVPYGTKSSAVVEQYAHQAATYLVDHESVEALVVACNSAAAAAIRSLRQKFHLDIFGVIEPGALAAVRQTRSGIIGVLATEGTVRSGAYQLAIEAVDRNITVVSAAAPLFVALAEEGWENTDVARNVADVYVQSLLDQGADTIVLGCTHYPLLRQDIGAVCPEHVTIVDSAVPTATAVGRALSLQYAEGEPKIRLMTTDLPDRFIRVGERFLGRSINNVKQINLDSIVTSL